MTTKEHLEDYIRLFSLLKHYTKTRGTIYAQHGSLCYRCSVEDLETKIVFWTLTRADLNHGLTSQQWEAVIRRIQTFQNLNYLSGSPSVLDEFVGVENNLTLFGRK